MRDEIIAELWRIKDSIAREFNYDIATLASELRKRQSEGTRRVVDFSKDGAQQVAAASGDSRRQAPSR